MRQTNRRPSHGDRRKVLQRQRQREEIRNLAEHLENLGEFNTAQTP